MTSSSVGRHALEHRLNLEHRLKAGQAGVTVTELMISIALGLIIMLAATALLLSTKSAYIAQNEEDIIEDTGRHALEIVSRVVRHAAYEHLDSIEAPVVMTSGMNAGIAGVDNFHPKAAMPVSLAKAFEDSEVKPLNGTDVFAVRFFGSGSSGDGALANCFGAAVPLPFAQDDVEKERGWSIFYAGTGADVKEPALFCKSYSASNGGKGRWQSQAIAQDVASFQVLYGIDTDTDADGLPNQYLDATSIDKLDSSLKLVGQNEAEKAIDKNRKTYWKKIVSVKVALLVHGPGGARQGSSAIQHDLFGVDQSTTSADDGKGGWIGPSQERGSDEKRFMTTISLRNHAAGSAL